MKEADYNKTGKAVTVSQFMALAGSDYKVRRIFPYCPGCGEILTVYAPHSHATPADFRHPELSSETDPRDDCVYANRPRPGYKSLRPSAMNEKQRVILRNHFFESEHLRMAYAFMHALCGKGSLSVKDFQICIRRADRQGIWAYQGIQLWVIPYILLTFGDFIKQGKSGEFTFRFVFIKPSRSMADVLWLNPQRCSLDKIFTDSGASIKTTNNPLVLSEKHYIDIASGNSSWIENSLLAALKGGI